jgi:hypothetical protein
MNIGGTAIPEHVVQGTPNFAACVPADATVLANVRGIICTVAGTLQAKNVLGVVVPIVCLAGVKYDISPIAVMTATTGTYVLLL